MILSITTIKGVCLCYIRSKTMNIDMTIPISNCSETYICHQGKFRMVKKDDRAFSRPQEVLTNKHLSLDLRLTIG